MTASGKSQVALEVAAQCGDVAICSVDSMTVYTEMDIGTAKPTAEDRALVPHFLLDLVDPAQEFSVAEFQQFGRAAMEEASGRGLVPLLVGGTGLYHRAIVDNLELPGQFPAVARDLADRLEADGLASLYAELERLDPLAATRMEPTNERRILRALEVAIGSGRPFSSFGPGLEAYGPSPVIQLGCLDGRTNLDGRIAARVAQFMDQGFLAEVQRLAERPGGLSRTARQAVGYRELLAHVDGVCSLDEAVANTVTATRQLARRQWSWFRRDPRITWVERDDLGDTLRSALATVRATGRMET